ncbi:unnamed protein product [marine sediment metagenome]|uniref:Uncharacterized protein n=1 Tax=marine sediment metagenome TaxID=412755 RepID=X1TCF0_9ZZZZ
MILFIFFIHCAWTESFETQNYFPPNDWIIVNEDGLDADTTYSGLSFTNLDYIITPQVLPNTSDSLLSFWYCATTSAGCSLDIMVSTASPFAMPLFNLVQQINKLQKHLDSAYHKKYNALFNYEEE